ncbi:MAG: hypothetical protein HZA93_09770 [Verrucomicrobia bacterium]|nr:hypothetical protein [Verrucomicrobiota bacterium]
MSYLTPPRLTFSGTSYANASTANNNDIANVYDIDNMVLNPSMALMSGGVIGLNQPNLTAPFAWQGSDSNPALRTWLMGLMQTTDPSNPVDGVGVAQMAHWNYYGDYNTYFPAAAVTNAVMATGPAAASDSINGLQVELLGDVFYGRRRGGVLVDIDPYALVTSQIFSGRFQLSYNVSKGVSVPVLIADKPTIAYSYFINPHKNLNPSCTGFEAVSAVFQFGLPIESLQFPAADGFASSALAELREQAQAARGLMVRYCLYDAIFKISAPELNAQFGQGTYVSNPYVGRVLGTIGLWNQGELASAPPGRKLRVQTPYAYTPPPPDLTPDEHAAKQARMGSVAKYRGKTRPAATGDSPPTKPATLGVALAAVDPVNAIVSLDCVSTFPEASTTTRAKFDLGPISLVLLYGTPQVSVVIGPVPYDQATYESGGGMVDISYADNPQLATINANLATGQLALYSSNYGFNLLTETPGADAQTDNRGLYFDCQIAQGTGTGAIPGTAQLTLQVLQHGVPPAAPMTLNLEYWMCSKTFVNPDKPQVPVTTPYFSVAGATPTAPTPYTLGYLAGMGIVAPPGNITVLTDQVQVPAGGQLTLNLTALNPGVSILRFVDPSIQPPPPPNFGWDNCDYATIRILPFNDYRGCTDAQINNWRFIYDNFFGFYSVLYPVMSNVVPWGPDDAPNNPEDVKNFAAQMLMLTDPQMWMSTVYMPITRDLSGGKRELLRRWCVLQQQAPAAPTSRS